MNFAAKLNKTSYVHTFINNGADTSIPDSTEDIKLPIVWAVENGNLEMVRILLEAFSPTASFDSPHVPLMIAVKRNFVQIAYLLIQYGADPNFSGMESEQPLEIAVNNNNKDLVNLLLASGANIQKVANARVNYKHLFDKWVDDELPFIPDPNPHADMDKILKQLTDELQVIQTNISKFITESRDIDFHSNFISPTLNTQNTLLVSFVKYIKRISFFGKVLFQRRLQILSQQYQLLANEERLIMESIHDNDEKEIYDVLERAKITIMKFPHLFKNDSILTCETVTSHMAKLRDEHLPKFYHIEKDLAKINRNLLCYLNQFLSLYNMLISEIYRLFDTFSSSFILSLDKALTSLNDFRDALIEVRQTACEIVVNPQWTRESKVDQTCIEQCEKITVDSAFILWEKEKFNSLGGKLIRCLRQLLH